ncbi:MAG: histidinol-phosphate transaminase [Gammaproteobacteria bacterium]|nr:histidinol-phosphate transaminase [Gammaproteobacteria bacterium]
MIDFSKIASEAVSSLRPYQPGKPIEELEREYGVTNIIKLASNENPFGPSRAAKKAMTTALENIWLYPDGNGFELKAALAKKHSVDPAQITLGNGSSDPLAFILGALVQPGDEVLYSDHSFAIYPLITQAIGGVGVSAPAKDWGYDLDAILERITARTKVIFIANPNNPTGTWLNKNVLLTFMQQVPEQVVVVVDEAYYEYAVDLAGDEFPETIPWIEQFPNLMVTRTFSKAYALAGARVGYSISHPQIADLMNRIRPPFNVNSVALAGAEAALTDIEHLMESIVMNTTGMAQIEKGVKALGLDYIPSIGNFISVDFGQPAEPIYEALLRHGVIVRPVANYAMPNHLRITVGRPDDNQRLLEGLAHYLGK